MSDTATPVSALLKQADEQPTHATRFQPGQSGNPRGRPRGSRNRLSETFISDLADDCELHGASAIQRVRLESPATYLKIVAAIVARIPEPLTGTGLEDVSDEALEAAMRHLLQSISSTMTIIPQHGEAS